MGDWSFWKRLGRDNIYNDAQTGSVKHFAVKQAETPIT